MGKYGIFSDLGEDISNWFSEKIFFYKNTNKTCVKNAIKQMDKIKSMVEKSTPLTKVLKEFGSDIADRRHLLGNLTDLRDSYKNSISRSRLGVIRRKIMSKLGRNTELDTSGLVDSGTGEIKEMSEDDNQKAWDAYKKAGQGMWNMLNLLLLNKPMQSWMRRLEIMSDKKFVQKTKVFKSFGKSDWNEDALKSAKNLYNTLVKVKLENLELSKGVDNLAVLLNGEIKDAHFWKEDGTFTNAASSNIQINGAYCLFPKYSENMKNEALKRRIEKILCKSHLRKFKLGKTPYAIFPLTTGNHNMILRKVDNLTWNNYDTELHYPGSATNPYAP